MKRKRKRKLDEFRTRRNVEEIRADTNCEVVLDELSRPDEVSYAVARRIMIESLIDNEKWFKDDVELISFVDYLMMFDTALLRKIMSNRGCFKNFVVSALGVVQMNNREKAEHDKKYASIMNNLKPLTIQ